MRKLALAVTAIVVLGAAALAWADSTTVISGSAKVIPNKAGTPKHPQGVKLIVKTAWETPGRGAVASGRRRRADRPARPDVRLGREEVRARLARNDRLHGRQVAVLRHDLLRQRDRLDLHELDALQEVGIRDQESGIWSGARSLDRDPLQELTRPITQPRLRCRDLARARGERSRRTRSPGRR